MTKQQQNQQRTSLRSGAKGSDVMMHIRDGMRVFDSDGEELGKVEYVRMGDPGAISNVSSQPKQGGILQGIAGALGAESEPNVPLPLRDQLERLGHIKIDGKGWIDTDRYVRSDQISAVEDDTVRLGVGKEALVTE